MRGRRDKQHPLPAPPLARPYPICASLLLSRAPSAPSPPFTRKRGIRIGMRKRRPPPTRCHAPALCTPPLVDTPPSCLCAPPSHCPLTPSSRVCTERGAIVPPYFHLPPQFPCAHRSRPPPLRANGAWARERRSQAPALPPPCPTSTALCTPPSRWCTPPRFTRITTPPFPHAPCSPRGGVRKRGCGKRVGRAREREGCAAPHRLRACTGMGMGMGTPLPTLRTMAT